MKGTDDFYGIVIINPPESHTKEGREQMRRMNAETAAYKKSLKNS